MTTATVIATQVTTEDRWKAAVKSLRASGVRVRQNIMECCRGCVSEEKLGMKTPTEPIAWTFGGQGGAVSWVKGEPFYRDTLRSHRSRTRAVEEIYFNHSNDAGQRIAQAFIGQGFEVDWDGTNSKTVIVKF